MYGIEKCVINGERERGTGRETGEQGNKKGKRGEKEILNKIGKEKKKESNNTHNKEKRKHVPHHQTIKTDHYVPVIKSFSFYAISGPNPYTITLPYDSSKEQKSQPNLASVTHVKFILVSAEYIYYRQRRAPRRSVTIITEIN